MGKEKIEYESSTGNVFADLGLKQPEELLAKAQLLRDVNALIKRSGLTQEEIATKLGVSQPKVSMLVSGKLSAFSTDTLLRYLTLLGCNIEIHVRKPRTRVTVCRRRGHIAVS